MTGTGERLVLVVIAASPWLLGGVGVFNKCLRHCNVGLKLLNIHETKAAGTNGNFVLRSGGKLLTEVLVSAAP